MKADSEISKVHELLGVGGKVDIVPMFIPIQMYTLILEIGKAKGISPADVISNALLLYAQPKQDIHKESKLEEPGKRPAITIRRR